MRHALYQTRQERPVKALVEAPAVAVIATPQDNVPVPLDMEVAPAPQTNSHRDRARQPRQWLGYEGLTVVRLDGNLDARHQADVLCVDPSGVDDQGGRNRFPILHLDSLDPPAIAQDHGDLTTFKNPNAQPTRLAGEAVEHRMGIGDPIGPTERGAKEIVRPHPRDQATRLFGRQKLHGYAESALQRGSLLQPRPVLPG